MQFNYTWRQAVGKWYSVVPIDRQGILWIQLGALVKFLVERMGLRPGQTLRSLVESDWHIPSSRSL